MEMLIMILGFALAAYSVVGNDVIQTLGTFLTSNERRPWWVLWLYAGGILSVVLVLGFTGYGGFLGGDDVCFDRLDKINIPDTLSWWYILPPLILLFITRWGIPVSTTFLILSFFSTKSLPGMLFKSLLGYALAFAFAIVIYLLISKALEKKFQEKPLLSGAAPFWQSRRFWTGAQWLSTGFLWTQWLSQDLANIFIYLGRPEELSAGMFGLAMVIILGLLAYIFYVRGGAIQGIVSSKTNTADIRSATFIDLIYGVVLLIFKQNILGLWEAKLPMSTTWVFLGLLAGRELAIRIKIGPKPNGKLRNMIFSDIGKAAIGLVVSISLVILLKVVEGEDVTGLF
ncbi:MAG: hypothetical protein P8H59_01905 [Flavobacteriales bacterium]|nr:hypothetical protein [Flavobacteriales bacterium]MDG1779677.1 hypothetical protein [Flavobacteriales bacterium]MDG2245625.1 hypothetical protein [Flavobacteriales bacterium]